MGSWDPEGPSGGYPSSEVLKSAPPPPGPKRRAPIFHDGSPLRARVVRGGYKCPQSETGSELNLRGIPLPRPPGGGAAAPQTLRICVFSEASRSGCLAKWFVRGLGCHGQKKNKRARVVAAANQSHRNMCFMC